MGLLPCSGRVRRAAPAQLQLTCIAVGMGATPHMLWPAPRQELYLEDVLQATRWAPDRGCDCLRGGGGGGGGGKGGTRCAVARVLWGVALLTLRARRGLPRRLPGSMQGRRHGAITCLV
jgi:hypothetical protein